MDLEFAVHDFSLKLREALKEFVSGRQKEPINCDYPFVHISMKQCIAYIATTNSLSRNFWYVFQDSLVVWPHHAEVNCRRCL